MLRHRIVLFLPTLLLVFLLSGCVNPTLEELVANNRTELDQSTKAIEEQMEELSVSYEVISENEIVVTAQFDEVPENLVDAGLESISGALEESLNEVNFVESVERVASEMATKTSLEKVRFIYKFVDVDGEVLASKEFEGTRN